MPFFIMTSDTHGYPCHAEIVNGRFVTTSFAYLITPPEPIGGSNPYAAPRTPLNISGYSMNIPVFKSIAAAQRYFVYGDDDGIENKKYGAGTGIKYPGAVWIYNYETVNGRVRSNGDINYYKFRVHTAGSVLIFLESPANISFFLNDNKTIIRSEWIYTDRHLIIRDLIPDYYYIGVSGSVGDYQLTVSGWGVERRSIASYRELAKLLESNGYSHDKATGMRSQKKILMQ